MRRRSSSGNHKRKVFQQNDKAKDSTSFLAKLQMLRAFVSIDSSTPAFDESDLSSCLRKCGYNVELAAERLMTGQYKSSPKSGSAHSFFSSTASTSSRATPSSTTPHSKRSRIHPPSSSSAPNSVRKNGPPIPKTPQSSRPKDNDASPVVPGMHLLLCQRWLVGLSTTRYGNVVHKESLALASSNAGPPMVRFKGRSIEGTLPFNLCAMLSPLLRYQCAENDNPIPLISIQSEALMEERGIPMGGEVPLSLSVFLENPRVFFALFDDADSSAAGNNTSSSLFFGSRKGSKKKKLLPVAEAAFALLQWAEYGDVPTFEPPSPKTQGDDSKGGESFSESADASKTESEEEEEEASIVLREEQFETEVTHREDDKEEETPEWANSVVDASPSSELPEASDPTGLCGGVTLRPYQRQALYWMMKRENDVDNKEELRNELELLSELARKTMRPSHSSSASDRSSSADDIACECGPVIVSEAAAKQSATLEGELDPVNHPLWQRRFLAEEGMRETISFYVNELLGVASGKPPNPPRQCVGGILSDAMGLGKTVMLLSLILKVKETSLSGPAKSVNASSSAASASTEESKPDSEVVCLMDDDDEHIEGEEHSPAKKLGGTTLVVAPLSLIAQWEEEIATKTSLSHRVHYGDTARRAVSSGSFAGVDVVVTSYGTIQGELLSSKKNSDNAKRSGLLSYCWDRVILDEAHCIKNPLTVVSKACCMLKAEKRWCVTGTPIQNSLQDVYALLKFLRHEPWCEGGFWKTAITSAISQGGTEDMKPQSNVASTDDSESNNPASDVGLGIALDRVRRLLNPIILRRTKDTLTTDGKPILILPPVETVTVNVELSFPEREFYNSLLQKSQSVFEGFLESGTATKSWFAIFSLLQRLRQACDHVALTVKAQIDQSEWHSSRPSTPTEKKDSAPATPVKTDKDELNDEFLEGLLEKFRMKQSPAKGGDPSLDNKENVAAVSYTSKVAHSLSQAVQSRDTLEDECPICLDPPQIHDAVITPCAHIFCRDCLVNFLRENASKGKSTPGNTSAGPAGFGNIQSSLQCPDGECPCCNEVIKASRIIAMSKSAEDGHTTTTYLLSDQKNPSILRVKKSSPSPSQVNVGARETLENALKGAESAKLSAVISELHKVWEVDPGSKVIVFSQFLGFLSLLEMSLRSNSIPFNRLDGKMSLKERVAALEKFNKAPTIPVNSGDSGAPQANKGSVLLVSMRAGGVGLNLVAASCVFIVDPWWNAAVEDQCVNRIHRIGQTAEVVRVRKFVVTDSVEERIVMLQRRKKDMASEILNDSKNDGDLSKSRPTLDDFKLLFGT